jgi:hypothetical protein
MNFNFIPPTKFIVLFFRRMVSMKVVHALKVYPRTKFNGLTLTSASFAFTSEV